MHSGPPSSEGNDCGTVISLDNMNDYYDRTERIPLGLIEGSCKNEPVKHIFIKGSIADKGLIDQVFANTSPRGVNLAAQGGSDTP